jgi:hypothetical protein
VISVGEAHAAQREDLYGCLYFYLLDQLRTFSECVKRFRITFYVLDSYHLAIAKDIRDGALEQLGFPKTIHFDRIDLSSSTAGAEVIASLAPLLSNTSSHATLLSNCLDWASGSGLPMSSLAEVMAQLYREQVVRWLQSSQNITGQKPSDELQSIITESQV